MDIKKCEAEEAQQVMEAYEQQHLTIKQFYRVMQEWIAPQTLVDKSTFYPLDLETLKRGRGRF